MASKGSLLKKTIFRVFAFAVMVTVGSFVFSILERQNADKNAKATEKTLQRLQIEMGIKYNMTRAEFDSFAERSHEALGQLARPKWDYVDGLRFAFETLTTIGYGAISPSTRAGQGLCMAFALLGIPVTILAFQSVGEVISRGISSFIGKTERSCFKREPTNVEAKCTAVTSVLMIIMLVSGAGLQTVTEGWTFVVGLYFWFVSFATIGYGDYIPDKYSALPLQVALSLVWTTFGLCVVSSVLNSIAAFMAKRPQSRSDACACYCDCPETQEWEYGEGYEKTGAEINHNGKIGCEKNGFSATRVDNHGVGKRCPGHYSKKPNVYRGMTYV